MNVNELRVLDLYAGPGGWDEGMASLGITNVTGVEWDQAACATAEAAGHKRVRADVSTLDPARFTPVGLLAGSPPCTTFSMAGHGAGRLVMGVLHAAMGDAARGVSTRARRRREAPDLFGSTLLPWVSMAQALGWDGVDRPARTVCGARSPRWAYGQGASSATGWTLVGDARSNATVRGLDEPAGAVFSSRAGNLPWALRNNTQGNGCELGVDEPSPTLFFGARSNNVSWVASRPATTVAADPRIAKPGHRDRAGGERQHAESVRVSVAEAAVLQGFRPDYPWQGTKSKQFEQVGNAVPPPLAAAIVSAALGLAPVGAGDAR